MKNASAATCEKWCGLSKRTRSKARTRAPPPHKPLGRETRARHKAGGRGPRYSVGGGGGGGESGGVCEGSTSSTPSSSLDASVVGLLRLLGLAVGTSTWEWVFTFD